MKLFIILSIALIIGVSAGYSHAGPFLDLDIGAHVTQYHDHQPDGTRWLGSENPIGILRAGYQTDSYNAFGPVDISVHGYYEHMSSIKNNNDTGVDVIMFGLRFE